MAERRERPDAARLDTPKEQRRPLLRAPSYDPDAFGVFAEQFARFMGTARFLMWMTVFVVVLDRLEHAGPGRTSGSTPTRSSS